MVVQSKETSKQSSLVELLGGSTKSKNSKVNDTFAQLLSSLKAPLKGEKSFELIVDPKAGDLSDIPKINTKALENLLNSEEKKSLPKELINVLSNDQVHTLIHKAKEYLKNSIEQKSPAIKADSKEMPKTLMGLVELADKMGINMSEITLSTLDDEEKPLFKGLGDSLLFKSTLESKAPKGDILAAPKAPEALTQLLNETKGIQPEAKGIQPDIKAIKETPKGDILITSKAPEALAQVLNETKGVQPETKAIQPDIKAIKETSKGDILITPKVPEALTQLLNETKGVQSEAKWLKETPKGDVLATNKSEILATNKSEILATNKSEILAANKAPEALTQLLNETKGVQPEAKGLKETPKGDVLATNRSEILATNKAPEALAQLLNETKEVQPEAKGLKETPKGDILATNKSEILATPKAPEALAQLLNETKGVQAEIKATKESEKVVFQPLQSLLKELKQSTEVSASTPASQEVLRELPKTSTIASLNVLGALLRESNETNKVESKDTTVSFEEPSKLLQAHKEGSLEVKSKEAVQSLRHFAIDLKEAAESYKPPFTRITMKLNPEKLGEIEVTLVQRGNNVHVNIQSNNANSVAFLAHNATELKAQLAGQGITNATMNFMSGGENQSQNPNPQQQQNRFQSYQSLAELESNEEQLSALEIILPHYA